MMYSREFASDLQTVAEPIKKPVNRFLANHIRQQLLSRVVIGSYQHELISEMSNEELIMQHDRHHKQNVQKVIQKTIGEQNEGSSRRSFSSISTL